MALTAEIIIPDQGVDDLGLVANASMTFLQYELRIRLRAAPSAAGPLEIVHESMRHISQSRAHAELGFPHSRAWRESVVRKKRNVPYIETLSRDGQPTTVITRADSQGELGGGRPRPVSAANLPRTVLSTANNAAEYRTLVLARHEMMRWAEIQLEPSSLRQPDRIHTPPGIGRDGSHLAATLLGLVREAERGGDHGGESLRAQISNRLAGLVREVQDLTVQLDESRNTVTLVMHDIAGGEYPASLLSDGTLRFIAIALLQADHRGPAVLCFEEPENGIHPGRIQAMLQLFRDYATDVTVAVDADNPLRQVIVNTHSPSVVADVPDDALLVAVTPGVFQPTATNGPRVSFRALPGTWRQHTNPEMPPLGRTELADYLSPVRPGGTESPAQRGGRSRRVIDRDDLQLKMEFARVDGGASA
jgi:predicted ATPase